MCERFQIGPVSLLVDTAAEFRWTEEVRVFRTEAFPLDAKPFVYRMAFIEEFAPLWGSILHHSGQMLIMDVEGRENRIHFLPGTQEPFALMRRIDDLHVEIMIDRRAERALKWDRTLLGLFALEHDCLQHHAFLLHASYIIHEGKAILFTAPSGNGKSTQADLWKKYAGAQIINGDRAMVFFENGQWYAGGFPVCGSSDYCLNRTAQLKAIVYLEKATENNLHQLTGLQIIRYLYGQTFVNRWNKQDCSAVSDMLIELSQDVPVFRYACTKEPDAVLDLRCVIDAAVQKVGN